MIESTGNLNSSSIFQNWLLDQILDLMKRFLYTYDLLVHVIEVKAIILNLRRPLKSLKVLLTMGNQSWLKLGKSKKFYEIADKSKFTAKRDSLCLPPKTYFSAKSLVLGEFSRHPFRYLII